MTANHPMMLTSNDVQPILSELPPLVLSGLEGSASVGLFARCSTKERTTCRSFS